MHSLVMVLQNENKNASKLRLDLTSYSKKPLAHPRRSQDPPVLCHRVPDSSGRMFEFKTQDLPIADPREDARYCQYFVVQNGNFRGVLRSKRVPLLGVGHRNTTSRPASLYTLLGGYGDGATSICASDVAVAKLSTLQPRALGLSRAL